MMNNTFLSVNIVALLILIVITTNKVFNNGSIPTCDNYISNVYLYLLIWIELATIITYYFMNNAQLFKNLNAMVFYGMLFAELGILIFFTILSAKNQVLKHILATTFITLGSVTLGYIIPYYKLSDSAIYSLLIITMLIFCIMSYFGHKYKDSITSKMIIIYSIIVITYIILEIVLSFFMTYRSLNDKIITFIGLIIVSIWLLFKTKSLVIESKSCIYPDYVGSSMSFFVTMKNIFLRLLMLKSKTRR